MGAAAPVLPRASVQLGALARGDDVDVDGLQRRGLPDFLVHHQNSPFADRPHRELRLEGDAELPDHDDIEGGVEGSGDLEGDGHAAAGQPEHDGISPTEVGAPQHLGQVTTGLPPIAEPHCHLLGASCSVFLPRSCR